MFLMATADGLGPLGLLFIPEFQLTKQKFFLKDPIQANQLTEPQ
jgi:hypothetical protein